jgi:hypothetical protein
MMGAGARHPPIVLLALLASACVGPQVSDLPGAAGLVRPAGAVVPSLYDDPEVVAKIADADGVDALIPIFSGFAGGNPARYWDLGPAPDFAAPVFVLYRREGEALIELPHPPIFGQIPGDTGYSPYRRLFEVEVTAAYAGEIIPSVTAINEAQERGLVGEVNRSSDGRNWPVAVLGAMVNGGGGGAAGVATGQARTFFFDGKSGSFLDFGATPIENGPVPVPTIDIYVMRREGGEPLSEPARGVDMDGDGDTLDTNNVFAATTADPGYSPRCREVTVTVAADVTSIDTSRDETQAQIRAAEQLFAGGVPVTPPVVAFRREERAFNCPQRPAL